MNHLISESGNKDAATKERTIDWVQRRFTTQKEALSVPLHHSCQEIPSQTFVESPKYNAGTTRDRQLWSDEEYNSEPNTSITPEVKRGNTQQTGADKVKNMSGGNYSFTGEILSDILAGVLASEQVGSDDAEVLQDTVRSNNQIIDGKLLDTNGTVHRETIATVSPTRLPTYDLQEIMLHQSLRAKIMLHQS